MRLRYCAAIFLVAFGSAGCNYRKSKVDEKGSVAQASSSLSYMQVAREVFTPSCVACHGRAGGVNLETYAAVHAVLGEIDRQVFQLHAMPRPPAPPLNASQQALLRAWLDAGGPEGAAGPPPAPTPPLEPTFASIHDRLFARKCELCHNPKERAREVEIIREWIANGVRD